MYGFRYAFQDTEAGRSLRRFLPLPYGFTHRKLAASSVEPLPWYRATWGKGQSGRERSATPSVMCDASS